MTYLKQYEYVSTIARCGGISQAAEALGLTQPTLSKHLKKIEEEVELLLFDRSATPLKLTQAGELFLESRLKMADLDRQFQKRIDEIKASENAIVRIGISPSRAPYMLPPLLAAYRKKNPNAKIVIEERTSAELSARLSSGELDLIISILDEDTAPFARIPLFEEHMLLAVPSSDTSNDAGEALKNDPLITVGKGQALFKTAVGIISEMEAPIASIECQSIESGLALVKNGLGSMIVPSYICDFMTNDRERVRFLPLPSEQTKNHLREICLFYRKNQFQTQAEKDFILCLETIKHKKYS